jgi:hypothetical protein
MMRTKISLLCNKTDRKKGGKAQRADKTQTSKPGLHLPRLGSVCHADTTAVGTNPGGTIADAPEILAKALFTDLKTTGAIKAIRQLFLAAMTGILFLPAAALDVFFSLFHQESCSPIPSIACSGSFMTKVAPLPGFPSTWIVPW